MSQIKSLHYHLSCLSLVSQTMFKLNVIWKKNTGRIRTFYWRKNPPSLSNNLMITWTNKYNPILFNVVSQDKRESNGIKLFFVNISISNI